MLESPRELDRAYSVQSDSHSKTVRSQRTNLLLSGSIEAGELKGPVRIRNLSETGALLEGAALPPLGEQLTLRRLDLEIGGTVVWKTNGRCGVRFDGSISVAGWRTGTWIPQLASSDQARVDQIQASVRSGVRSGSYAARVADPIVSPKCGSAANRDSNGDIRIARELKALQHLLIDMSGRLSDDPAMLASHSITLQKFDIASQILGHLAHVLAADDRASAIGAIGMDELRIRLRDS